MLRSEHVMARLYRGRLVPHSLSPEDRRVLAVAEELCDVYAVHVGLTRSRLERELAVREEGLGPGLDPRRGFKIVRALSKLLEERAGWTAPTGGSRACASSQSRGRQWRRSSPLCSRSTTRRFSQLSSSIR
jgi:uncharacterized protein